MPVVEHGLNAGVDIGFQPAVLRFEVNELHSLIFAFQCVVAASSPVLYGDPLFSADYSVILYGDRLESAA